MFNRRSTPLRTLELEARIQSIKRRVRRAVVRFATELDQGELFSAGTSENIINDRYAEMDEFFLKLDKIKRSVPSRLIKQIRAFKRALPIAAEMKNELQQHVFTDLRLSQFKDYSVADDAIQQFRRAHQETAKKYHDAARHILLQKKISLNTNEMDSIKKRVKHLNAYAQDPVTMNKLSPILEDLADIEYIQRKERYKAMAGLTLRVIGWGIIIFATVIAINPAVGWTVIGVSMLLTIIGELINIAGKKLREPSILKNQTVEIRNALRLFKTKPIEVLPLEATRTDSPDSSRVENSLSRSV
jgi:hypothetical protein